VGDDLLHTAAPRCTPLRVRPSVVRPCARGLDRDHGHSRRGCCRAFGRSVVRAPGSRGRGSAPRLSRPQSNPSRICAPLRHERIGCWFRPDALLRFHPDRVETRNLGGMAMKSHGRPSEVIGWMGSSGSLRAYPKPVARAARNSDTPRASAKATPTGTSPRAKTSSQSGTIRSR
jgi:hypothetical protein